MTATMHDPCTDLGAISYTFPTFDATFPNSRQLVPGEGAYTGAGAATGIGFTPRFLADLAKYRAPGRKAGEHTVRVRTQDHLKPAVFTLSAEAWYLLMPVRRLIEPRSKHGEHPAVSARQACADETRPETEHTATMDTVTINGTEYRPTSDTGIRIVVAQRGWVFVGRYERDGDDVTLTDASVVRVWGTTKGLGEIAATGPTSKTVLDRAGTVHLAFLGIVASLDCNEDSWASKL